jgi:CheY-like chemotaxis protein
MLLVDDDATLLHVTERFARALQFDVVATTRPREALQLVLSGESFAVLVSDVEMPSLRGPDLAAQIAGAGHVLPTLFVSGADPFELARSNQRWLAKPFTLQELAAELRALGLTVPIRRLRTT